MMNCRWQLESIKPVNRQPSFVLHLEIMEWLNGYTDSSKLPSAAIKMIIGQQYYQQSS